MAEYTDIGSMSPSLPAGSGQLSQADDHIRGVKTAVKNTFPEVSGVVTANTAELNALDNLDTTNDVEDRFTELEAYFNYTGTQMTVAQMTMLWDLETDTSVEGRLAALEYKLSDVDYDEVTALDGYNTTGPNIEDRFVSLEADVSALVTNNTDLWTAINFNTQWRTQRESVISNNDLNRIASYLGAALPLGYNNDLGSDFQLVTNKVEQLEYLVSYGIAPGQITWKTLIAELDGGSGGINVTNAEDATDTWGFVMKGLLQGTRVDFQFFDGTQNQAGPWASDLAPQKMLLVDSSGEVNGNLRLGNFNWGPNNDRLVAGNWGRVTVQGWVERSDFTQEAVYQTIYCQFY